VAQPELRALLQLVEEGNALADQLDLLRVVELETKGASRHRRRQGGQRWALFQDESLQPGAFRKEGGGAPDDAASDDDEVGGLGR